MNAIRYVMGAALLALAQVASATTLEIEVNGLVCAFCAQGIEKTIRKFPAADDVYVSLENRLVAVSVKAGSDIAEADLKDAIKDAGYTTVSIERTETSLADLRKRTKAKSDD